MILVYLWVCPHLIPLFSSFMTFQLLCPSFSSSRHQIFPFPGFCTCYIPLLSRALCSPPSINLVNFYCCFMSQLTFPALERTSLATAACSSFNTLYISYISLNPVCEFVFPCISPVSHTLHYVQWKQEVCLLRLPI